MGDVMCEPRGKVCRILSWKRNPVILKVARYLFQTSVCISGLQWFHISGYVIACIRSKARGKPEGWECQTETSVASTQCYALLTNWCVTALESEDGQPGLSLSHWRARRQGLWTTDITMARPDTISALIKKMRKCYRQHQQRQTEWKSAVSLSNRHNSRTKRCTLITVQCRRKTHNCLNNSVFNVFRVHVFYHNSWPFKGKI